MSFLTRTLQSGIDSDDNTPGGYLYEAQSSCVVTGYNSSYWTAISFSDTYFYPGSSNNDASICGDNEDMLPYYDGDDDIETTDPLTIGMFAVRQRKLDPRHYFLEVSKSRLQKVRGEWGFISHNLSFYVRNYVRQLLSGPPGPPPLSEH